MRRLQIQLPRLNQLLGFYDLGESLGVIRLGLFRRLRFFRRLTIIVFLEHKGGCQNSLERLCVQNRLALRAGELLRHV